ncbi:MAG: phage tail assembly protein [Pseudomonadota bacterium]
MNLIAVLTGLPLVAVEKLDMRDYMAPQRQLAQFMKA